MGGHRGQARTLCNGSAVDVAVNVLEHECVLCGSGVPAACAGKTAGGASLSFGMAKLETLDPLGLCSPALPRPPPRQACLWCVYFVACPSPGPWLPCPGRPIMAGCCGDSGHSPSFHVSWDQGHQGLSALGRAEGLSRSGPSLRDEEVHPG